MDNTSRLALKLAMVFILPSMSVSQVARASIYSSNQKTASLMTTDPTIEIEKSCRQKAKEIAVATYSSCFSDEKTAQVEKLKNDYHLKLKALKSFYEAEIKRLSDIKSDLKEQHKNNEKNEHKDKNEAKKEEATAAVGAAVLANKPEESETVAPVEKQFVDKTSNNATKETSDLSSPEIKKVETLVTDKSTDKLADKPTEKTAESTTQQKNEQVQAAPRQEVIPVVIPETKATETVSEPLPVKPVRKSKVAAKNAPKTVIDKKNTAKTPQKKSSEKIISQVGDEKIVLKKDDKINVSKNNAKAVSKKSAKNDSSLVQMKSVKSKKAKKELNNDDGMKNNKLDAIKSTDNKDKETAVVSVLPTESDLNSDPAEYGMTVQLKPAPKIKAMTEESPADSTDLPEPIPVEGSNSGSAW